MHRPSYKLKNMKKLDKEQLKAVIDSFREYVAKGDVIFLDALKEKGLIEEEFEVGKWYKLKRHLRCYADGKNHYGFYNSRWDNRSSVMNIREKWELSTDSEVSTALITEAKKRGFKEGVKFDSAMGTGWSLAMNGEFTYGKIENRLFLNGHCVFNNGKWALIRVEEEKEFLIQVQKGTIIIEGKEYTAEEIINKFK